MTLLPSIPGSNRKRFAAGAVVLVLSALVFGVGVPHWRNPGPGAPAVSAGTAERAGKRYALFIGVNKYDGPLRDLPCAENDVEELAGTLAALGYDNKDFVLLTDRAGAADPVRQPRLANIRREVAALSQRCRPQDTLLVALAGHGTQLGGDDEPYFLPADANFKDSGSFLSIVELYAELARCRAGAKLLLVDACRSNERTRSPLRNPAGPALSRPTLSEVCGCNDGIAVLFSCSSGQITYENQEWRHGEFFHFVIEGLKGPAARGDGRVTLRSLQGYLTGRVADDVKDRFLGVKQVPDLEGRLSGAQCLVESAANPKASLRRDEAISK